MAEGKFITFEGGEGAGKSTQAELLRQNLAAMDVPALLTREPGGSPRAEAIRAVLLSGKAKRFGPMGEALLFYVARDSHLELTIRPALARGTWVICDRFHDSTRAYQGAAGGVSIAAMDALERIVVGATKPDLTLILDLPPEEGLKRVAARAARRWPGQGPLRGHVAHFPPEPAPGIPGDRRGGALALRRHRRQPPRRQGRQKTSGRSYRNACRSSDAAMARQPRVIDADTEAPPEADRLDGWPHPRETSRGVWAMTPPRAVIAEAIGSGRLHHAWLMTGEQGIGKATFAYRAARFLLSRDDEALGVRRRLASISRKTPGRRGRSPAAPIRAC